MKKKEFEAKIQTVKEILEELYEISFEKDIEDVNINNSKNINCEVEIMIESLDKIKNYLNIKKTPAEIKEYFFKKYEEANFRIVPGHEPEFQSKDEVDNWFKMHEKY